MRQDNNRVITGAAAACLLAAIKLEAIWQPGRLKDAALGNQLTYYSAYELAREFF